MRRHAVRLLAGLLVMTVVVAVVYTVTTLAMRWSWVVVSVLLVALYVYACAIMGRAVESWWIETGRDRALDLMDRLPLLPARSKDDRGAFTPPDYATPPNPDTLLEARYCARCAEPATAWRALERKPNLWQAVPMCATHAMDADLSPFGHGA